MNITTKKGFRTFVIISTLMGFGIMVDSFFPSLLSPELQKYFAKAEVTSYGMFLAISSGVLFIFGIIALVGVLMFRQWGRILYVIATIAGILFLPFCNELIASGLSATFLTLSNITQGMILVLMYISPVKEYFETKT